MKKSVKFYVLLSLAAISLILSGCAHQNANGATVTAKNPQTDDDEDSTNIDAEKLPEEDEEEPTEGTHAIPTLQLVCLPYEPVKENKLQDVAIILNRYLSGDLQPVVSYELDESKEYLLIADIALPDYSSDEKISQLQQERELNLAFAGWLEFESSSKITTLSCRLHLEDATSAYNSTIVSSKGTSAFFCGTGNRGYALRYFCSMSATSDSADAWTAGQFLDCSHGYNDNCPSIDFHSEIIDIASCRFLAVYEIKLGTVNEFGDIKLADDDTTVDETAERTTETDEEVTE